MMDAGRGGRTSDVQGKGGRRDGIPASDAIASTRKVASGLGEIMKDVLRMGEASSKMEAVRIQGRVLARLRSFRALLSDARVNTQDMSR
jgi:hypothetical protein